MNTAMFTSQNLTLLLLVAVLLAAGNLATVALHPAPGSARIIPPAASSAPSTQPLFPGQPGSGS